MVTITLVKVSISTSLTTSYQVERFFENCLKAGKIRVDKKLPESQLPEVENYVGNSDHVKRVQGRLGGATVSNSWFWLTL